MQSLDINVASPDQVSTVLRRAADSFRESMADLQSNWQNENAGRVWGEIAKILDRAADSTDRAVDKFFV